MVTIGGVLISEGSNSTLNPTLNHQNWHRWKTHYLGNIKTDEDAKVANTIELNYSNSYKLKYTYNSKEYKLIANWVNVDVAAYLNKNVLTIKDFPVSPERLAGVINMFASNEVNSNQAKEIFAKMLSDNLDAKKAKEALGISSQISDVDFIKNAIDEVLKENPQAIVDYKEGKGRAMGFLIGQIMKKTQGKINPKLTSEMLAEELKNR